MSFNQNNTNQVLRTTMNVMAYQCATHFGERQSFKQGLKGKKSFTVNGFVDYKADFIKVSEVTQCKKLTRIGAGVAPMQVFQACSFLRTSEFWNKFYRFQEKDVAVKDVLGDVVSFLNKNARHVTVGAGIVTDKETYVRTLVVEIAIDKAVAGKDDAYVRIALCERDMYSRASDRDIFSK